MTDVREMVVARLWDGERTPREIARAAGGMTAYEVKQIVARLRLDAPQPEPQPEPEPPEVAPPVAAVASIAITAVSPAAVPIASDPPPPVRFYAPGYVIWDEPLVAWLERQWKAGRSYAAIAEAIGGTRSQIAGKVSRLGMTGRREENADKARAAAAEARRRRAEERAAQAAARPAKPRRATLLRQMGVDDASATPAQARPEQLAAERSTARSRAEARAPEERPCTLVELTRDRCRWPLGDPASESFRYCGGRRSHKSYCAHHGALAYQPRR